jgi:hypothetical protein
MNTIKGTAEVTFDVGGIMARIIGAEAAITRLILRLGENIDDYGLGISPIGVMASQDLKKALDKDIWDLARTETAQAGPRVAAEVKQVELALPPTADGRRTRYVPKGPIRVFTKTAMNTIDRIMKTGGTIEDLVRALPGYAREAIYNKARRMGYTCGGMAFRNDRGKKRALGTKAGMWTGAEMRVLRDEAAGGDPIDATKIKHLLPGRSLSAICAKARDMGFASYQGNGGDQR